MSNLSKLKRDRLTNFLSVLEKELYNGNKLDGNAQEYLNELKSVLLEKKYGLVWEEHSEHVDQMLKYKVPVLEPVDKYTIRGNNGTTNFILEGDNYHSLKLLEKTHKNGIDLIYIDPPYNTHNSLTYNDKRVSADDDFRHSKWISFMNKRLEIAQTLLNDQGLIFISIDDNEGYNLKLLCDEIFGLPNFMGSFSVTKAEGGGQAKYLIKGHDLVLVYAKNLTQALPMGKPKDVRGQMFTKDGEQYWIQEDSYRLEHGSYGNLYYEDILEYKDQEYKDNIDKLIAKGEVILVEKTLKNEDGSSERKNIMGKVRKLADDYSLYNTVLKELNKDGKNELKNMGFEGLFDYPKPLNLIKELISGGAFLRKGSLTVLDFFAGSGTTGHAVLELVKELERDISFILCTNNEVSARQKLKFLHSKDYLMDYNPGPSTQDNSIENRIIKEFEENPNELKQLINDNREEYDTYGICQSVTYPRIEKVINGYSFTNTKSARRVLKKYKITPAKLDQINLWLKEIEDLKEKTDFNDYTISIDANKNIVLYGIYDKDTTIEGIPANLIYLKTNFVDKIKTEVDDYYLSDELLRYIEPMIELENMADFSVDNFLIILDENQLDKIDRNKNIEKLFVSNDVLLPLELEEYLINKSIEIKRIPEYYFKEELQEVGEM